MSTSTKRRGGAGTKLTTGRNAGRSTRTQERTYTNEGIYSNCRYTHVATSLIGCTVQVQVRNGDIYDGVLDTVSSDMKVVLKKAHKISEFGANVIQSRDLLEEVVVYSLPDIVAINANDVDLEYAVKDSFTDGSISKYNGQVGEKELTPWDSEGGEELVLETGSSNGWDPDEMFKTNQEQFNVKSTYDDNLSQYTTVLDKSNPKYQRREEVAAKIAQEIEHTAGYRARIDLENGDGDEEDKFSAVVRPGADNSSSNGTAKYIPPDRRNRAVAHGDGPSRGSPSRPSQPHHRHGNTHAPPVMQHSPHLAPTQPPQPSPAELRVSPVSRSPVSTSPLPNPQTPPSTARTDTIQTEKGDSAVESPHPSSPPDPVIATEPKPSSVPASSPNNKTDHSGVSRDEEIRELIAFSSDFKLSESEGKTLQEKSTDIEGAEELSERKETEQDSKDKQLAEAVKKSTLNPNAKEFVFNPKSIQPKHSNASTPTPPRPHTQSPVIHPQQSMPLPYAIYPMGMPPMATSQPKVTKRAVVSLSQRSDFNAAAQAATGQPLLAQTTGPFMSYQLIPGAMPQHVHPNYHHQMLAVNPGTRMGPSVSVMSNPGGQEPNHQYSVPIFNTLTPPVPAHLPHPAPHQPPTPAHMSQHPGMAHHPQPHSQPHGGMAGPQGGGHHPPPSPVQPHTAPAPGPQPTGHPPSSGTPQSHIIFPGNPAGGVGQQSHPPLQASPHNPASPSAMHHLSMPTYTFNHPPHGHSMPGAPPMSIPAQAQHHPGSGPHMMHVAHSAGPQMMLPHPQHAAQMQPAHQFPGHQVPGHVGNQGPGGHMVQQPGMGVIPVSQSSASMPYIPHHQVPNQGMPQQQSYPHSQ